MSTDVILPQYREAGRFIRERRARAKYSLDELVDAMNGLGVPTSKAALQRLETGRGFKRHFADEKFMNVLAKLLQFSLADILAIVWETDAPDDPFRQRVIEMINQMDRATLETAEQLLNVLVAQHDKTKTS